MPCGNAIGGVPGRRRCRGIPTWIAIVAAFVALAVAAPDAKATSGSLTISGKGTASATLSLSRATVIDLQQWSSPSTKGSSGYVGFYFRPEAPSNVHAGSLSIKALRRGSLPEYKLPLFDPRHGGEQVTLGPGSYRVYLLADAPTTVVLPWSQPVNESLSVNDAETGRFAIANLWGSSVAGYSRRPLRTSRANMTASGVHVHQTSSESRPAWEDVSTCVGPKPVIACLVMGATHSNRASRVDPSGKQETAIDLVSYYGPGKLQAGDQDAVHSAISTANVRQLVGWTFTLEFK
jgi:hypothetical protein